MSETFFSAAGGGEEVEGIQLLLPAAYDLLFGGISFVSGIAQYYGNVSVRYQFLSIRITLLAKCSWEKKLRAT